MTQPVSRRRFLTDLAFIVGALALAVGLASTPPAPAASTTPTADANHPQFSAVGGLIERP